MPVISELGRIVRKMPGVHGPVSLAQLASSRSYRDTLFLKSEWRFLKNDTQGILHIDIHVHKDTYTHVSPTNVCVYIYIQEHKRLVEFFVAK